MMSIIFQVEEKHQLQPHFQFLLLVRIVLICPTWITAKLNFNSGQHWYRFTVMLWVDYESHALNSVIIGNVVV